MKRALPDWLLFGLLVAGVFIAYSPAWNAGFIWDDDFHLTENACIVGPLGFLDIWTSAAAYYYPMVLTSFWVQHWFWGLSSVHFHLFTIAVHAATAVVLWQVLAQLRVRAPWLAAAVWALHPVQVESVAWVTELKNTQSGFFFFLAIWLWLKWRKTRATAVLFGGESYYFLTLLSAFCAYTSKTSTVMLPIILATITWWLDGALAWRKVARLAPIFGISAIAAAWTIWEQHSHSGASGAEWNQSLVERGLIASRGCWFYLQKALWPYPLMFIYPRIIPSTAQLAGYLPIAAIVTAALIVWRLPPVARRAAVFSVVCFIALLFPVLGFFNVYFFRYSFVADHFQYLASVAPIALIVAGASSGLEFLPKAAHGLIAPIGAAWCLGILSMTTWERSHVYQDNETLWRDALEQNPQCWLAHITLGKEAAKSGQRRIATAHYREALALNPAYAELHNLLGNTLQEEHQFEEAAAAYRAALQTNPRLSDAHSNLGVLLLKANRVDEAIAHFNAAVTSNPASVEAHNGLGNALLKCGRPDEAIREFGRTLEIAPEFVTARFNLANTLVQLGRVDQGIYQYQRALKQEPDAADLHMNLGVAFYKEAHWADAIYHFRRALVAEPNAEAHANLANALRESHHYTEALAHYSRAIELDPKLIRARYNAAWICATCPDPAARNAQVAVALAEQVERIAGENDARTCRLLAAAYAEAGRFSEARGWIHRALALAGSRESPALITEMRTELSAYQAETPTRSFR